MAEDEITVVFTEAEARVLGLAAAHTRRIGEGDEDTTSVLEAARAKLREARDAAPVPSERERL